MIQPLLSSALLMAAASSCAFARDLPAHGADAAAPVRHDELTKSLAKIEKSREARVAPILIKRQAEVRAILDDNSKSKEEKRLLIEKILLRYDAQFKAVNFEMSPEIYAAISRAAGRSAK